MNAKTRRVAAHRLVAGDTVLHICAVEITDGQVTRWEPLDGETPHTEWLGGTITLRYDSGKLPKAYKDGKLIE